MIEIKFTPEKSLLAFAEWFSSNYKKLPAGHYHSDPLGYSVRYLNGIKDDNGRILLTLSRISNKTGIIEIDKHILRGAYRTTQVSITNQKGEIAFTPPEPL
jgi:hypothetical protein